MLHVGSVKTNVGHLEGAAGITGLLKTILSVAHRELPASLNYENPNPDIALDDLGLRVHTSTGGWPRPDSPLVAGVSSFGMGGTNCHLVVTEAPELLLPEIWGRAPEVLPWVLSGASEQALREQATRLLDHLDRPAEVRSFGGSASRARVSAPRGSEEAARASEPAGEQVSGGLPSHAPAVRGCGSLPRGDASGLPASGRAGGGLEAKFRPGCGHSPLVGRPPRSFRGGRPRGRTVFVFPGQGSQWPGMAAALLRESPEFARSIHECAEALDAHTGWSLVDLLTRAAPLERVDVIQPALSPSWSRSPGCGSTPGPARRRDRPLARRDRRRPHRGRAPLADAAAVSALRGQGHRRDRRVRRDGVGAAPGRAGRGADRPVG